METTLQHPKQLVRQLADPKAATEAKAQYIMKQEIDDNPSTEQDARDEIVTDPVTGARITISNSPEEADPKIGANILNLPLPQPDLAGQKDFLMTLFRTTLIRLGIAYILTPIVLFTFAPSWLQSRPLLLLFKSFALPSGFAYFLLFRLQKHAEDHQDEQLWDMERRRGLMAGSDLNKDGKIDEDERVQESAEWLNTLLRGVWPIINPDMFTSAVDMLEDIMQSSVPKFIHSVRITDLGQGINPIRITSIRSLPDAEDTGSAGGLDKEEQETIQGEHINLEISFAYRALPATSRKDRRAQNAHLLVEFYVGLHGVVGVPVPVWAEITGAVGTARVRVELIPDPPFIKHTLITLMGLPKVSLSITPLHKRMLPNVMDIPFISQFITKSINMAAQEYVAPKSLMLDLQTLLSSDGILRDSSHAGVIVVHIHNAKDLKSTDKRSGDVDPYVCICLSPTNKPQYSTRIIMGNLNPVFEETAVLLVDSNAAKVKECVSLQIWDSDRFTVDDMIGHVEIDVVDLMKNKNRAVRRTSPLKQPFKSESTGTIEYTIGFYAKIAPGAEDGSQEVPSHITESPEYTAAKEKSMSEVEGAVMVTPPSQKWPSGILTMQIHEIRELGVSKDGPLILGSRETGGAQHEDRNEEAEESDDLPSAYCTVLVDDEPIYRTRTKPMTSSPFFNTTNERFVRDWRTSHVCLVVRDSRMRERDPIIGMVHIKLSEIFESSSQCTRSWSLQRGVGYGRIRVSFCFRPVHAKLPASLLGFDTGVIEIRNLSTRFDDPSIQESTKIRLYTSTGAQKVAKHNVTAESQSSVQSESSDSNWSLSTEGGEEYKEQATSLPVQRRYRSALVVSLKKNGVLHRGTVAMGVVWLRELVDNKIEVVRTKLWSADNYDDLKQNYSAPASDFNENNQASMKCIGEVELELCFRPGVNTIHQKSFSKHPDLRKTWEEVEALRDAGFRDNIGRPADMEEVDSHAHGKTAGDGNTIIDSEKTEEDEDAASLASSTRSKQGLNVVDRVREWRDHEEDLKRANHGMQQVKPVRTAEWMRFGILDGLHHMRSRLHRSGPQDPKMDKE